MPIKIEGVDFIEELVPETWLNVVIHHVSGNCLKLVLAKNSVEELTTNFSTVSNATKPKSYKVKTGLVLIDLRKVYAIEVATLNPKDFMR